jgi:hypothetical protein
MSMMEDFWLPRREGGKGTEITTLPGGQNLGELEDVKYFEKKLYKSLGVPIGRLEPQQGFSLGRSTEITRDELKFNKFIQRLRNKFAILFDDMLRVQLVLKKICTEEEWKEFKEDIWYDFKKDNNFDELKEAELINLRIDTLAKLDPFVGKYYSQLWVRKNVLMQTDEDIEEINAEMEHENAIVAQQQQQQMAAQQQQQQQNQQDQLQFQAQQQITQAAVQDKIQDMTKGNDEVSKPEQDSRDHEQSMLDKKIELERIKNKKITGPKKKTVASEARQLGLRYIGEGKYANTEGEITHLNENGILTPLKTK